MGKRIANQFKNIKLVVIIIKCEWEAKKGGNKINFYSFKNFEIEIGDARYFSFRSVDEENLSMMPIFMLGRLCELFETTNPNKIVNGLKR